MNGSATTTRGFSLMEMTGNRKIENKMVTEKPVKTEIHVRSFGTSNAKPYERNAFGIIFYSRIF
jgi:hypothetical protein